VSIGSKSAGSSTYLTTTVIWPVARGIASSAPLATVTNLKGNGSITRFLRVFPTGYKSGPGKPVGASWSYPVVRIR
jgi:hypothetical protein